MASSSSSSVAPGTAKSVIDLALLCTCRMCAQIFNAPLALRCQHMYCTVCLHERVKNNAINCPVCGKRSSIAMFKPATETRAIIDFVESILTEIQQSSTEFMDQFKKKQQSVCKTELDAAGPISTRAALSIQSVRSEHTEKWLNNPKNKFKETTTDSRAPTSKTMPTRKRKSLHLNTSSSKRTRRAVATKHKLTADSPDIMLCDEMRIENIDSNPLEILPQPVPVQKKTAKRKSGGRSKKPQKSKDPGWNRVQTLSKKLNLIEGVPESLKVSKRIGKTIAKPPAMGGAAPQTDGKPTIEKTPNDHVLMNSGVEIETTCAVQKTLERQSGYGVLTEYDLIAPTQPVVLEVSQPQYLSLITPSEDLLRTIPSDNNTVTTEPPEMPRLAGECKRFMQTFKDLSSQLKSSNINKDKFDILVRLEEYFQSLQPAILGIEMIFKSSQKANGSTRNKVTQTDEVPTKNSSMQTSQTIIIDQVIQTEAEVVDTTTNQNQDFSGSFDLVDFETPAILKQNDLLSTPRKRIEEKDIESPLLQTKRTGPLVLSDYEDEEIHSPKPAQIVNKFIRNDISLQFDSETQRGSDQVMLESQNMDKQLSSGAVPIQQNNVDQSVFEKMDETVFENFITPDAEALPKASQALKSPARPKIHVLQNLRIADDEDTIVSSPETTPTRTFKRALRKRAAILQDIDSASADKENCSNETFDISPIQQDPVKRTIEQCVRTLKSSTPFNTKTKLPKPSTSKARLSFSSGKDYDEMFISDKPQRKVVIACSRISKSDKANIIALTNCKIAAYSSAFNASVTHLVVDTNESNCVRDITINLLNAVAAGIWVVNTRWITDSLKANHLLSEEVYEVSDQSGRDGPRQGRLYHTLRPLFKGFKFYVSPIVYDTSRSDVHKMIENLGGVTVNTPEELLPKSNYICIIITDNASSQDFQLTQYEEWLEKLKVITVDMEWLTFSICYYQIMNLRRFVLCSEEAICDLGYPDVPDELPYSKI